MICFPGGSYRFLWHDRMADIPAESWDRLAQPLATPILEWEWLHQMEASGSIVPETGWQPAHLTAWRETRLVGAAPLYIKTSSEGEFLFDYHWQTAAEMHGLSYAPRLVGMSPVTPLTGYRFLSDPREDQESLLKAMMDEIDRFAMDQKITSRHFLFTDSRWMDGLPESGSIRSVHQGFIWENPGCPSFDDYLETFSSGQRRNIRKERSFLNRQGFKFLPIPGEDADKRLMDWMYRYYEHTNDQHGPWSCKYLKPAFFDGIHRRYRHRLLFMAAYHERLEHIPVGISMLIHKGPILLGRYWGSIVPVRHLHFNVCYYEPIVWAIRQGVTRFDPGLGGAHKIRRGFQAVPTYSLHRFYDSRLNHLVGLLIQEENRDAISHITDINAMLPFSRKENREYGKDQM